LYALDGNKLAVSKWPVDPAFLDLALARLFQLPSRIKSEEWKSIASAVGATVRPVEEKPAGAEVPASAPRLRPRGRDCGLIMARLDGPQQKLKERCGEHRRRRRRSEVLPRLRLQEAMAFWTDGPDSVPETHRKKTRHHVHETKVKAAESLTPRSRQRTWTRSVIR